MPASLDGGISGLGHMSDITSVSSGDVVLAGSVPTLECTQHNRLGIGALGGGQVQSRFMEKFPLGDSERAPGRDLFNHLWCSPTSSLFR